MPRDEISILPGLVWPGSSAQCAIGVEAVTNATRGSFPYHSIWDQLLQRAMRHPSTPSWRGKHVQQNEHCHGQLMHCPVRKRVPSGHNTRYAHTRPLRVRGWPANNEAQHPMCCCSAPAPAPASTAAQTASKARCVPDGLE
jgi:hypothetical protein